MSSEPVDPSAGDEQGQEPPAAVPLFHLALADEWDAARATGAYRGSTLGRSLADEGFIHCSFAHQVTGVADAFYRGRTDVVLLRLDPSRLDAPVRVEAVAGSDQVFPHLYGPLSITAVEAADPVVPGPDGRLVLAPLLRF